MPQKAGDHAEMRRLIAQGANVNRSDVDFHTPLHCACDLMNATSAALLLDARGDPNVSHPGLDGWTPLHLAAWRGAEDCVELLLSRGADPNALDWYGKRPVDWTSDEVKVLLETRGAAKGEDRFIQIRGKSSATPSVVHLANIERCLKAAEEHGTLQGVAAKDFDPTCKL